MSETTGFAQLQGDGKSEVEVGQDRGKVILKFEAPKLWVGFDPENANAVAEAMVSASYAVRYGKSATPQVMRDYILDRKRTIIINRLIVVMKSMQDQNKTPAYQAGMIADICMHELV